MSIKTRSLVFATFFGSCIVLGFLVAALTTDYWISAEAKRHTNGTINVLTKEPAGKVNFGLFSGYKGLNIGYGVRPESIDVLLFMRQEPESMSYWLWLGAALGVGFGLLSSAIAAIASVLKSASMSKKRGTLILLFISNVAAALSQMLAFICWLVQFYQYLTHNVLTTYDRETHWYTHGLASLGHSFYFIVIGIIFTCINITLLVIAVKMERRERRKARHDDPAYDEKAQGAIMLY